MHRSIGFAVNALALVACVAAGAWIGTLFGSAAVVPDYVSGDYSALRRETGTPVVLFSASTCAHCRSARELLEREAIAYTELVVDESPDARARFAAVGGDVVPLLLIGDRAVRGFREDAVREALAALRGAVPRTGARRDRAQPRKSTGNTATTIAAQPA